MNKENKANNTKIIELRNVCKNYKMGNNIVKAVCNVNLTINRGQFIAIMGPSGSGKSTLMNLIGALDVPSAGKIFLDNKDISLLSESELAQLRGKKIGFIFQQFNLIKNLTALENVMLPMTFQGVSLEERKKRATILLNQFGLSDRLNHTPNELSGGQQQRVAIARALANDPEVILADEPTGNLDTKTGGTVMDILSQLHNSKKTIIIVTHDSKVAEYAETIFLLRDGKIIGRREGKNHLKIKNK